MVEMHDTEISPHRSTAAGAATKGLGQPAFPGTRFTVHVVPGNPTFPSKLQPKECMNVINWLAY